MAEYYPLLAKAVAALPQSTPETRRAIYERARKALLGQLRKIEPPIPEEDIQREDQALDSAIARLETELSPAVAELDKAFEDMFAAPVPVAPPAPVAPSALTPSASPKPSITPPLPLAPKSPLTPPPVAPKPIVPPPPIKPVTPPAPPPASARPAPLPEAKPVAQQAPAAPADVADAMDAPPLAMRMPTPKSPKQDLAKPADEADPFAGTADREEDFSPFDPVEKGDAAALKMPKTQRPAAPGPAQSDIQRKRFWLIGGVVGVLVIAVAGLAYKLRDKPEDLARRAQQNAAQVEQQAPAGNGKIVERVGAGARDTAARPSTPQPVQPTQQQAPVADSNPAIPVANRAALLLESPDEPTKVKTYIGTVIWRLDNVPGGPGQPLTTAVRADVDVPDAKLTVSMIFEKNTEATLPASHTIKLRFKAGPDSSVGNVKQVNVPQMRREESPSGDPIMGIPVPIMENSFLIGLARGNAEATNLDLITNRLWFDVPMLLSSGKVAKITFEKGVAGERAINEAVASWSK